MNLIPFDSRRSEYKSVFGSIAAGEGLRLRVMLPRELQVSAAYLVVRDGKRVTLCDLYWESADGATEWWGTEFVPHSPALLFYHFAYDTPWGRGNILRMDACKGSLTGDGEDWQLTVYSPAFQTPDWLRGGIIYQIFPDRFYNSGQPKESIPAGRILRDDWGGTPVWQPDADGKYLNNDFFGGDLAGITEKLPYLKSLGVTCLYLNPIAEAHSNHRYDTADYLRVDPLLGDAEDFRRLCDEAHALGIRVLFDGVYSHTGADSVYFNQYGRYDGTGAFQSKKSPYFPWYRFRKWPHDYASWWGIRSLPEVNENDASFARFITGANGVLVHWLSLGADGVRLDVADELPDLFLERVRRRVKQTKPDALVLGEVWEDASNKSSYGVRRRYLLGGQLDSVTNYPFRTAILRFLQGGTAERLMDSILTICENYPPPVLHSLMNVLGTHDTERVLTLLGGISCEKRDRSRQANAFLRAAQYETGRTYLKMAAALLYTLPGVPCLYYGDEAGVQGCKDPFNRACFPWGHEDAELTAFFKTLGDIRTRCPALREGRFIPVSAMLGCICYVRGESVNNGLLVIANRNPHPITYRFHSGITAAQPLLGCTPANGGLAIAANTAAIAISY